MRDEKVVEVLFEIFGRGKVRDTSRIFVVGFLLKKRVSDGSV